VIKRTQKVSDQEANTNSGRNLSKKEQLSKVDFFEDLLLLKSISAKLMKVLDITWGICTINFRSKRYFENFYEVLWCSVEICFRIPTSPNLTSLKLEVLLGTTTKQK
jgi:hypothetical protein